MSIFIDHPSKKTGMYNTFAGPLAAAAVGGVMVYLQENDTRFQNLNSYAKYAGLIGAANLLTERATKMILPEFTNPKLRAVQEASTSAVGTGLVTILGANLLLDDGRTMTMAISGGMAGGAAPFVVDAISSM